MLQEGIDYEEVDGTICVFDHVDIPPSMRVVVDGDDVSLAPARGPDVGLTIRSAPSTARANNDLVYRGPAGHNGGRRAPRRLPQN